LHADCAIAASGGNHGLAVAHVARQLDIPAKVFVPEATSALKVARIRALGATVTVTGAMYDDAYDVCLRHPRPRAHCSCMRTTSPKSSPEKER
jgi:threonine dehydratase